MIFKLSLPSDEKNTRQRSSLPSVKKHSAKNSLSSYKNKTLGKELFCRVFYFTEGFLLGNRERTSLPSARKNTCQNI